MCPRPVACSARGQAGGAGDPEEIVLGSGLSMTGTTLSSEASFPVTDTTALVHDPTDNSKRARIDAGGVAPSTTRTITMGDRDVDLAAVGPSQSSATPTPWPT